VASAFSASEMCVLEPRSKLLTRSLLEGGGGKEANFVAHSIFLPSFIHSVVLTLGSPNKVGGQER
jgi:hypothetical protein